MINQAAFVHLPKHYPEGFMARMNVNMKTGCWDFLGAITRAHQYPRIMYSASKRLEHAHRISYKMFVGPIPPGLFVLHSCDNKRCVSPSHLRVGTHAENMADMKARFGRHRWSEGQLNPKAKFTEAQIREIRKLHAAGVSINSLSIITDTYTGTISKIVRGLSWRRVSSLS